MTFSEIWSYEFMRYALLSACVLGPACALLGVFVTLRGMAFFSDALAHSAVTGVALGFFINEKLGWDVDPMLSVLFFSMALAGLMAWLFERSNLSPDSVIAFSFTGSVALGVVLISWLKKYRLIDGILFGSIYSNSFSDLLWQLALAGGIGIFLLFLMKRYTLSTLSPELSLSFGIRSGWLNYVFAMLIAATVVVALKMLGALLLSALIVIPPAASKLISGSFRKMLLFSLLIGFLAPLIGVLFSCQADVPTGPSIVLANVCLLFVCYLIRAFRPSFHSAR